MDARIHAATELLACGALKNRNVIRQGPGKGIAVIYEWSELGLRMLMSLHAVSPDRQKELKAQIASVRPGEIPPQELLVLAELEPPSAPREIDMAEAVKVDTTTEATSK